VLDEIGRGTSTFDGISIAWAVAEAMLAGGVKTLFATHYHELAGLASEHDLVVNRSVAVRRYKGSIVFLYRVVEGAASGSYGIEVARLAGVPDGVTEKAEAILKRFEERPRAGDVDQMGLFSQPSAEAPEAWEAAICKEIAAVDADTLSPLEALNLLDGLVRRVRKVG
ncbi:MAG: DNA mismatch repair protein MutS, partial [Candidatus Binatia bacterium]